MRNDFGGRVSEKRNDFNGPEVYVGKMVSRGECFRPPQNHFRNDFKGGVSDFPRR